MKTLPFEEQAITMYVSGVSPKEIREKLNISNGSLYNVLQKNGIELRRPQGSKDTKSKTKKCPICKAHNNPLNAKFCCMCGADIRSEIDIVIQKLDKSMTTCIKLLPTNAQADVIDAMQRAIVELRKRAK